MAKHPHLTGLLFTSLLLIGLFWGVAQAQPLKPMAQGSFDGIPVEQAMSTLHVLGRWQLPQHGTMQVFTMGGGRQQGCFGSETDPDQCSTARLYVAAKDSLTVTHGLSTMFYPETYFLLRGVNGTGWYLPEGETLKFNTTDRFSLVVCGTEFTTQLSGGAIIPTAYTVRITRQNEKGNQFSFSATMDKYDVRSLWPKGCGPFTMLERDENFRVGPTVSGTVSSNAGKVH